MQGVRENVGCRAAPGFEGAVKPDPAVAVVHGHEGFSRNGWGESDEFNALAMADCDAVDAGAGGAGAVVERQAEAGQLTVEPADGAR